jgi:hypothetical protein
MAMLEADDTGDLVLATSHLQRALEIDASHALAREAYRDILLSSVHGGVTGGAEEEEEEEEEEEGLFKAKSGGVTGGAVETEEEEGFVDTNPGLIVGWEEKVEQQQQQHRMSDIETGSLSCRGASREGGKEEAAAGRAVREEVPPWWGARAGGRERQIHALSHEAAALRRDTFGEWWSHDVFPDSSSDP